VKLEKIVEDPKRTGGSPENSALREGVSP
jgi:hypothetical protein